jgi:phage tail sheath protein FI
MYYQWIMVSGPVPNQKKLIPPSASVAGRYAYTDTTRGVHKVPAGMENGLLRLTTATEISISSQDASRLNAAGINPIISNPAGFYIWGARTLSQDPEWKYLNIRRLQIYIDQSLRTGLGWVAFEPSGPPLWARVQQSINPFLTQLWRKGAFMGNKAEEAFFVKVDAENNPPASVSQDKLNITVGFAPIRPAEFIVMNISLNTK